MTDTSDLDVTENEILPHIRLQLNIDKPGFDDCWSDGYQCALKNFDESENPYKAGTKENEFWSEGWWAGFYGEEPIFELAKTSPEVSLKSAKTQTVETPAAVNDSRFGNEDFKKWMIRVVKLTGIIAVAVAAYELSDLAA